MEEEGDCALQHPYTVHVTSPSHHRKPVRRASPSRFGQGQAQARGGGGGGGGRRGGGRVWSLVPLMVITPPASPKREATPASLPSVPEILAVPGALGVRPVHSPQVVLGGPSGLCGLCDLGFQGPQAGPFHQEILCHLCSQGLPREGKTRVSEQRTGRCPQCRHACAAAGPAVPCPGAQACVSGPRQVGTRCQRQRQLCW